MESEKAQGADSLHNRTQTNPVERQDIHEQQLHSTAASSTRQTDFIQSLIPDLIHQAIIVTDMEGTIIYWNNYATSLYGWKREDVIGKNVMALMPTDLSFDEGMAIMEQLQRGQSWSGQYQVKHKNGHHFLAHVHDSPFYDEQGQIAGIIGVSRDVTEELKTKEFLHLQTNLLDNVEQAVLAADLQGIIFYSNRFAEELFGFQKNELINQSVFEIFLTANGNRPLQEIMALLQQNNSFTEEAVVKNKTGRVIDVVNVYSPIKDEQGIIKGIIAVATNIDEQVKERREKEFERTNQQALINATTDLIWSVAADYTLITANRSFIARLLEYTGVSLQPGDKLLNEAFFPADYLAFWKKMYDRGFESEHFSFELHVPSMQGVAERWSEATINPIFNTEKEVIGVACYGRDITDAKLAEKAIAESRERFRIMFEKAPLGIALIDSYTGNIIHVNEKFAAITGRTMEELKTVDWMSITHPDDVEADLENMQKLNRKEIPGFTMQKRYIKPDNSIVWIQMSIVPIEHAANENPRHLCMIEDITQMKEYQQKIELSNERFNMVAKATNDAIWDWDLQTNNVTRVGEGLEKYFGYQSQEASKNNNFWLTHVHPDDLPGILKRREIALQNKNDNHWSDEYRFKKANGEYAVVYDKGYIMRDKNGTPVRIIGATQDITELKKADALLNELNKKLERRAEELEKTNKELEQFAYIASHDLQEPLRMISSFLQLLERKYKHTLDETADKYIHFAIDGAERMKQLITDLLEYSRTGRSQDEPGFTDMNKVIAETLALFEHEITSKNVQIDIEQLPILPNTIKGQMLQLMQNIISNGLKYNRSATPHLQIKAVENNEHYIISIKDNGIGFDPKYSDKVFMIFQRLHNKSEFSGTGIGLAICKKIMELHGGSITVESTPGSGSTFKLFFLKNKHNKEYATN